MWSLRGFVSLHDHAASKIALKFKIWHPETLEELSLMLAIVTPPSHNNARWITMWSTDLPESRSFISNLRGKRNFVRTDTKWLENDENVVSHTRSFQHSPIRIWTHHHGKPVRDSFPRLMPRCGEIASSHWRAMCHADADDLLLIFLGFWSNQYKWESEDRIPQNLRITLKDAHLWKTCMLLHSFCWRKGNWYTWYNRTGEAKKKTRISLKTLGIFRRAYAIVFFLSSNWMYPVTFLNVSLNYLWLLFLNEWRQQFWVRSPWSVVDDGTPWKTEVFIPLAF